MILSITGNDTIDYRDNTVDYRYNTVSYRDDTGTIIGKSMIL